MLVARTDITHNGTLIPAGTAIPESEFTQEQLDAMLDWTEDRTETDEHGLLKVKKFRIVEEKQGKAPDLFIHEGVYKTRKQIEDAIFGGNA